MSLGSAHHVYFLERYVAVHTRLLDCLVQGGTH